jgi:cytochrome c-type biogenesis protein CcmH/NrfG
MIVWLLALLLALAAFLILWRVAKLGRAPLQMIAAGLCLALAGYAWQGRPTLAGEPSEGTVESEQTRIGAETFAVLRRPILGQVDNANAWLTMADALLARGNSLDAVGLLQNAVRRHPRDPDLWIGLGNALFLHANAQMTPAVEFAFLPAEDLAPANPAPLFFRGMALAQAGQLPEAEAAWRRTLVHLPPGVSWRPLVEERLQLVMQLRAMAERAQSEQAVPPQ